MQIANLAARAGRSARALLDALLPGDCSLCSRPLTRPGRPFCDACAALLPWWRIADGCPRCGMPADPGRVDSWASWGRGVHAPVACPRCLAEGSPLHRCFAALRHAEPIMSLIPAFKNPRGPFGPSPAMLRVVDHLVAVLVERMQQTYAAEPDLVVPVPLHRNRLHDRGFNHADWIAERVARAYACPVDFALLSRVRDTGSQAGRSARERRAALRGAFRASRIRAGAAAPRIILVDDVLTTGSTLEAAGEALLASGAGEVVACTLSATVARRASASARPPVCSARPPEDPPR